MKIAVRRAKPCRARARSCAPVGLVCSEGYAGYESPFAPFVHLVAGSSSAARVMIATVDRRAPLSLRSPRRFVAQLG